MVNDRIYVLDLGNNRVQSFPLATSSGSPDGTTVLRFMGFDNYAPLLVAGCPIAFDRMHNLTYLIKYNSFSLSIFTIINNNFQLTDDSPLFLIDGFSQLYPISILIDQISDYFYVTELSQTGVIKFRKGSRRGTMIAGGLNTNNIYNKLFIPIGLTFDSSGYLYIVDWAGNRVVQLLNENGDLRTIAGQFYKYFSSISCRSKIDLNRNIALKMTFIVSSREKKSLNDEKTSLR